MGRERKTKFNLVYFKSSSQTSLKALDLLSRITLCKVVKIHPDSQIKREKKK